jgi:trehalose 6-phosphate phosphatase
MTPAPARGASREIDIDQLIPSGRLKGRPLLLLLDVDGTLAPIVPDPSLARVPDETRRIIASLAARADVRVVLVSGRAAHDARRVVGVERVWTIGNHGAEVMTPDGEVSVEPEVERHADAVARAARTLAPLLSDIAGVMLENKTWTLSVHYRRADERVVPRLRAVVDGVAVQNGLRVGEGKKILEIRPPVPVDKGTAIARITRQLGGAEPEASIFFAGDDVTDEDAFRWLRAENPHAVTVHVGDRSDTAAEFRFTSLDQVRAVLEYVARPATLDR